MPVEKNQTRLSRAEIDAIDQQFIEMIRDLAKDGRTVANYAELGKPLKLNRKRVSSIIERLERKRILKTAQTGAVRSLTLINERLTLKIKPGATFKGQWSARPVKRILSSQMPVEAQEAIDKIRRRGIVAYAERVNERSTALSGRYIVGRNIFEFDELLAFAETIRKAA